MPRRIFIDADTRLKTWKKIADAGNYLVYEGDARSGDIVLRWGCNHHGPLRVPDGVRVLNPVLILSKAEQARRFIHAEVSFPAVYETKRDWIAARRPAVVVKPHFGSCGIGMKILHTPQFTGRQIIYQKYIDKKREFRAMMVGEIMAFFMEKHPPENGDFRWNEHRGARWSTVPEDGPLREKVRNLGSSALEVLKYDFGACDIIQDSRGKLYILEVNSRPEFEERNAIRFTRAIAMFLAQR